MVWRLWCKVQVPKIA
jgi:hypothetical protein